MLGGKWVVPRGQWVVSADKSPFSSSEEVRAEGAEAGSSFCLLFSVISSPDSLVFSLAF